MTDDPHLRISNLEQLVAELAARVAYLEQRARPEQLAERNALARARGMRLRTAISQLLEQHPGPRRGAAKRIYQHLATDMTHAPALPTLRTVRYHVAKLAKRPALQL